MKNHGSKIVEKHANHDTIFSKLKKFRQKFKQFFSFLKWIDPFYYVETFLLPKINPEKDSFVELAVFALTALVSAFIAYSLLGFLWQTSSPMVIVYSGSMEPTFYRGDIMALTAFSAQKAGIPLFELNVPSLKEKYFDSFAVPVYEKQNDSIQIIQVKFDGGGVLEVKKEGPVVVYYSHYLKKPIIHRAIALLHAQDGYYVLTKGDSVNNFSIDQDCGKVVYGIPEHECIELYPVPVSEIQGVSFFKIPFFGNLKLFFFDDVPNFLFGKS